MKNRKLARRLKIRKKIRGSLKGTSYRPRLSVFRSNREIYCQLIDDVAGHTLASASSKDAGGTTSTEKAKNVGKALAEKAASNGVTSNVVFDRGGYLYHGRVKALAEGAREGGLIF